jgi:hypothetical protein
VNSRRRRRAAGRQALRADLVSERRHRLPAAARKTSGRRPAAAQRDVVHDSAADVLHGSVAESRLGFDPKNAKAQIYGSGHHKISLSLSKTLRGLRLRRWIPGRAPNAIDHAGRSRGFESTRGRARWRNRSSAGRSRCSTSLKKPARAARARQRTPCNNRLRD